MSERAARGKSLREARVEDLRHRTKGSMAAAKGTGGRGMVMSSERL